MSVDIIYGSGIDFVSTVENFIDVDRISSSGFVVFYNNADESDRPEARVGQTYNNAITFGDAAPAHTTRVQELAIGALSTSGFVSFYKAQDDSWKDHVRIGEISGSTITYGPIYKPNNINTFYDLEVAVLTPEKFIVAFRDYQDNYHGKTQVGEVSGTTVTFGSKYEFLGLDRVNYLSIVTVDESTFLLTYEDQAPDPHSGIVILGSVSGTTVTYEDTVAISFGNRNNLSVSMLTPEKFILVFRHLSKLGCQIGTISGTTLAFGDVFTYETSLDIPTPLEMSVAALGTDKFVVVYKDEDDSYHGTSLFGMVNGTSITFGDEVEYDSGDFGAELNRVVSLDENRFVVVYKDTAESDDGTAIMGSIPYILSASGDLFIQGGILINDNAPLYTQGLISIDNNSPLYLGAYSLLSVSGDLFIEGLINIQSSGDLFIQGPLFDSVEIDLFVNSHETNDNNTTLYTRGLIQTSGQTDLFVNGFETINDDISLYLNGHSSINDNAPLYEEGHEILQGSQELVIFAPPPDIIDSIALFLEGPTSGDEGRAMDWFLRTSDHYPQLIGTFDASVSGVTIQVWDVVNAQNTSVPLTSSGCYSITDTGRWGWSTSNLPSLSGYQHQYYYLMTGDPDGTFDGQFFLEVPEDAKWTFPSSQDEYIM